MKTSFHRQNKNRAETEQEGVGEGVGEMGGLLCSHDPHRLQVHLWRQKAKEGRAGNPRAGSLEHSGKTSGATVGLKQKCPHPTHLCASDQTLPSPQG